MHQPRSTQRPVVRQPRGKSAMLVTDLDHTRFPNAEAEYDGSTPLLNQIISEAGLIDVWASGRKITSALRRASEFGIPLPDFFLAELGTHLFRKLRTGRLEAVPAWRRIFEENLSDWNRSRLRDRLKKFPAVTPQERRNQSPFKLSYYFEPEKRVEVSQAVAAIAKEVSKDALVVASVDPGRHKGFLDIVPFCADKRAGIEWLRNAFSLPPSKVVFAGDSGNDLSALTGGWKAIVVKNAQPALKSEVTRRAKELGIEERIYQAQGRLGLNGNFSSGILEGLVHHGFVREEAITLSSLRVPPRHPESGSAK